MLLVEAMTFTVLFLAIGIGLLLFGLWGFARLAFWATVIGIASLLQALLRGVAWLFGLSLPARHS